MKPSSITAGLRTLGLAATFAAASLFASAPALAAEGETAYAFTGAPGEPGSHRAGRRAG